MQRVMIRGASVRQLWTSHKGIAIQFLLIECGYHNLLAYEFEMDSAPTYWGITHLIPLGVLTQMHLKLASIPARGTMVTATTPLPDRTRIINNHSGKDSLIISHRPKGGQGSCPRRGAALIPRHPKHYSLTSLI